MERMLRFIRILLVYLDWIGLIGTMITFGIIGWSKSIWISLCIFLAAMIMLWIMIEESSKRYSKNRRISAGKPLGYPLIDCSLALGLILYYSWFPAQYKFLILCVITTLIVDFLLWMINHIIDTLET